MDENWINIEGELVSYNATPQLLKDLNLIPIFLRRFFEQKYIKDIVPDREEQVEFQQDFMRREGITDKDSLERWLQQNGKSEVEMNKQLYNAIRLEKFKANQFSKKVESIFSQRKSDLDRVTYSLLRVRSRAKAAELHIRLQEEETTFPELASTFSEGVENILHGLIGPIEFANVNPLIAERLRNSSSGQLWPPFEIDGWWLIVRQERFLPASLNSQMRQRLIDEMYENWIKAKIIDIMSKLEGSDSNS